MMTPLWGVLVAQRISKVSAILVLFLSVSTTSAAQTWFALQPSAAPEVLPPQVHEVDGGIVVKLEIPGLWVDEVSRDGGPVATEVG